jgi:hypothetical protein
MRARRRGAFVVLVALCGLAIAAGAFPSWVDARAPRPSSGVRHTAISGLLHWHYRYTGSFTLSFALIILACGALVFVGGVFASRLVAGLFSLIALAAAGVWIGLNATHYSSASLLYSDLRLGAWLAIGGGLIGLVGSFYMRRRQI